MQKPILENYSEEVFAKTVRAGQEVTLGIEDQIRTLHLLNPWKRFREIFSFLSLYFAGAFLVSEFQENNIILICAGIIFMAVAYNSLGILIHEGLHGVLSLNQRINHLLSFIIGVPILISATAYQVTHTNHHFELGRKLDYGTYKQHARNKDLIWMAYILQLLAGCFIYILLIPFLAYKSASLRSRRFIIVEYFALFFIYYLVFKYFSATAILYYWGYPILIMNFITNIRGLASHALGDVEDVYLSSRTIPTSKLAAYIFLNENFHLEHHLFPQVPSYNLPILNKLIWNRLPRALYSKSYLQFLAMFLKALLRKDLSPQTIIYPKQS